MLEKRGQAIINMNRDQIEELDNQITELKNENREQFCKPVSAFITFETQEGYERAIGFEQTRKCGFPVAPKKNLLSCPMHLNPASEPTNIIWENRHVNFLTRLTRASIVIAIMVLLMAGTFTIFYYMKRTVISNNRKYPNVDCQSMFDLYENDVEEFAIRDWYEYYKTNTEGKMNGMLQCFCTQFKQKNGYFACLNTYFYNDQYPICRQWALDLYWGPLLSQIVSYAIVFTNYFLRVVLIILIRKIG